MDEFNQLMKLDTMADAYVELTANGLPDRQLLAFIHADTLLKEGALEDFDIDVLHTQTLSDIEAGQYFELACEAFMDSLKSSLEEIKNFVTFNRAKPFSHFTTGPLVEVHSSITVLDYSDVKKVLALHAKITQVLGFIVTNIPKVRSYDEWKSYHQKKFKQGAQFDIIKARDKVAEIRRDVRKLNKRDSFEKSSWSEEKFKEVIHTYDKDVITMLEQTNKAAEILTSLRIVMTVSKYTKKHKNVISSMKRAVYLMNGATAVCRVLQNTARSSIKQVSRHYAVKKEA